MKTIIASTDFSPVSINAVNYAADMAMAIKAELILFNMYDITVPIADGSIMPLSIGEIKEGSEKKLLEIKEEILQRTNGKISISTKTGMGDIIEELEQLSRTVQPLFIIIGTQGKSHFEEVVFGSVALAIIRHLTWPVICVPPKGEFGNGVSKVGFACDFKEVTTTTPADSIKDFLKEFNAELHILNVDYNDKHFTPDTPTELSALYQMFEEVKPQYHFINNPDIEDGINEFVSDNSLDLLITLPKKHNLLERLFKPRSTKQLITSSPVPVLCLHK